MSVMTADHVATRVRASVGTAKKWPKKAPASAIPFVWGDAIGDVSGAAPEIVEDLLTAAGLSVWYGDSNSGKSYLVSHLAFCIARGVPWLGKRVRQGAVIYVAGEGAHSIEDRVRAHRKHFQTSLGHFGLVTRALNLLGSTADVDELVRLVRQKAEEIGREILLVVVDTVARAMAGADENSAQDMGMLVQAGDRIREETGAHVCFIHHSGKNAANGARGSSALRAATDTEVEVTKDEAAKLYFAEVRKQRDLSSMGMRLTGHLVPVELGRNQWGKPITACIVEDAADAPTPRKVERLPKGTETAWAAFTDLAGDSQRTSVATSVIPGGKRLVSVDTWRDHFYKRRGSTSDEPQATKRSEWNRAKKALIDARRIGVWGDDAWMW